MTTTQATLPVQTDTAIAALNGERAQALSRLSYHADDVRRAAGAKRIGRYTENRWDMTLPEALAALPADHPAHTQYDTTRAAVAALAARIAPLDAVYRAHRWSRFFLVPDGHVHASMDCHTCNRAATPTQFGWLPDLSGLTEADAVAEYGSTLCTVCFPTAPVEYTDGSVQGRVAREAADVRAADRAAKAADKLAKAVLPDGSPLRLTDGDQVTTTVAARRALSGRLTDLAWYGTTHPSAPGWQDDVAVLVDAIEARTGETGVLAAAAGRVARKSDVSCTAAEVVARTTRTA